MDSVTLLSLLDEAVSRESATASALAPELGEDFGPSVSAAARQLRNGAVDVRDLAAKRLAEMDIQLAASQGHVRVLHQQIEAKNRSIEHLADELTLHRIAFGGALYRAAESRRPPGRAITGVFVPPDTDMSALKRRVAIDALSIVPGVSGGVEVYMKTLVRAVSSLPGHDAVVVCRGEDFTKLQAYFGSGVGFFYFPERTLDRWLVKLGRRRSRAPSLNDLAATLSHVRTLTGSHVLHSPVQIFSCLDNTLPSVLNLHDLQHMHYPENFTPGDLDARDRLYGWSANLADIVVATSQFVANDIVEKMGVPREKVRVVPAAWNPDLEPDPSPAAIEAVAKRHDLPPTFILFPGQFWKHKNQARLVQALAKAREQLPSIDLHLVLTGYRGHTGWPAVEQTIHAAGLGQKVRCLDYVPLADLPALYKLAIATIVPSLFEASSYPVIEAQVMGCPSACSRVTSLPELMEGGAGLLFDPLDIDDIARVIIELCRSPELRASIVETASRKVRAEHSLRAYADAIQAIYDHIQPIHA